MVCGISLKKQSNTPIIYSSGEDCSFLRALVGKTENMVMEKWLLHTLDSLIFDVRQLISRAALQRRVETDGQAQQLQNTLV